MQNPKRYSRTLGSGIVPKVAGFRKGVTITVKLHFGDPSSMLICLSSSNIVLLVVNQSGNANVSARSNVNAEFA